jgi:hypothetical protein
LNLVQRVDTPPHNNQRIGAGVSSLNYNANEASDNAQPGTSSDEPADGSNVHHVFVNNASLAHRE